MGQKENYVESYLVKQGQKKGFMVLKFTSPGTNGVPDRILIGHDRIIFVETKAKGEKARPLQNAVIKEMQKHGAEVHILDTREKVDSFLQNF